MDRYLVILEVSQKQAYIFGSNKVADNIVNSAVIAKCLSPEYIEGTLKEKGYKESENLVYSGGGHTILEYSDIYHAKEQVFVLTEKIYKDFEGLSVFAKIRKYDEEKTPQENLKNLTADLEGKKALRRSGFHHGSFGIEKIDSNTLNPESDDNCDAKKKIKQEEYENATKAFTPNGYKATISFEDIGVEKDKKSFIAVVHIDGNGMGKRVEELYSMIGNEWTSVKSELRKFSECIDNDFKAAYSEMIEDVKESIENGKLKGMLTLKEEKKEKVENNYFFPIRRIITAGDDICFVTEGRIGIECARIFIEKLNNKINEVDHKGYAACAGAALVHLKYPFYRAYELAESLCSKAKKEGAVLSPEDNGRSVSSIDWHIEFGELKDSIDEIEKDYIADDGCRLTYRPYVLSVTPENKGLIVPSEKQYTYFAKNVAKTVDGEKKHGDGKFKRLRYAIKKGKSATENYVKFYKMEDTNATYNPDGVNPMFDAIELMDTFLFV